MIPEHGSLSPRTDRHAGTQGGEAEALRRERDLLSAVLDTAGSLVVLLDREGRIVRFNRACETTSGFSFAEARGQALWDLFLAPEEVDPVRAVFEQLRAGQFPNEYENHWITKDGQRRLIAWSNTALLSPDGAVEYIVGTGIDITDRRQAEELLRQAREALESRVAERTAELQRASELLAALHETALGILGRLDLNELLEAIVTRTANQVGGYAAIYLVDRATDELVVRVVSGAPSDFVGYRLKRGEGMCGKIWQFDRPMQVDRYNTWDGRTAVYPYSNPDPRVDRSMGVPLHSGQEVVGVLGISRSNTSPPFRQDELDLAIRLAQLASISLDNARLYSSLQQGFALQKLVGHISAHFIDLGPSEVDAGIQYALQAIGEFSGVDRSYVFQFSGDGTILDNTHEWCAEGIQPYIDSLRGLSRAAFPWFVGQLEQLKVVSVPRVGDMPPEASMERAECEREAIQSIILVPLAYRGMLVGFLGLDSVRVEKPWTEDLTTLLTIVGGLIVNALEHKRAQAIQAGQRQFLELLATGGSFSETLHTLVRLIEDQWPGMLGLILLLDEDGKHLHIGASVSLPQDYVRSIEGLEIGPMVGSCGTACYRRERVIVEDTATDPRWEGLRDLALRYSLRACWSEPVFSPSGQVVGTFAMYYRQPRAPSETELRTIEMGAHLVGVAIEHDRAERALRQSEERFRSIVEHANVGIAIVQEARFRFMNPHYAAMLGYTVEEMLGTEFMGYCTPEERDRIVDFDTRRTRGEPVPTRYETSLVHKNGGYVYADVSAGLIPYGGQKATFVFLRDITEERRTQQALQEAYRTLELRVEERTGELAALNAISAVVSRSLDLQEIMSSALDKTLDVMGLSVGAVYRLQAEHGEQPPKPLLRLMAQRGLTEELARLVDPLPLYGTFVESAAVLQRPVVWMVADYPQATLMQYMERVGVHTAVSAPLLSKETMVGAMVVGSPSQRLFSAEELSLLSAIGQQIGVAVENARLYEAEQARRQEAERRRQVAEGLREILATLNSSRPLGEILNYIASQASHLLGSDATALCRLDRQTQFLTIQASYGLSSEFTEHMAFQVGRVSIIGEAVLTRRPTTTSNLAERLSRVDVAPELRELVGRFAALYQTVLAVPMLIKDETYGALALYYRSARQFTEEEVNLAVTFADQAALAVENARLRGQAEEAAAMEERGRLARELHDSVTQSLYSVTMYAEAAARLMTPGHEAAAQHLRDARDTAQEALREMRLMIYQLRPPVLEKGGLAVALQVRLDAVERRGGIRAELLVDGEDRLPPAIQVELHQIAQEALNNALKHAHAHQVQVRLRFGQAQTRLEVQDDGLGFDLAAAQAGGGLGIAGMMERAQKIGGRLEIESAPGRGTQVSVEVPTGGGR